MFTQPSTLLPLLALTVTLAWAAVRPGALPAAFAVASAVLLLWAVMRDSSRRESALDRRIADFEARRREDRAALQAGDAARRRAEAALRDAEERYLLAVRGSQDGLWEWHLDSDTVQLSPRWKSMLGFDAHEIDDTRAGWSARVHEDDRARFESALAAHVASADGGFEQEIRLLHKDGRVRHVLSRGVAIRDESGHVCRLVGLDCDVTRIRRVQTVLDAVAEGTAGAFGEAFFPCMVRHFARALEVDRAFITECEEHPPTRLRTLGVWSAREGTGENFEYPLAGTPCEEVVIRGRTCFHREGLSTMFPREAAWESFLGLPIVASDGTVLGHLAFFNSRPLGDEMLVDSVYRIFLARAAAEIERSRALARLAQQGLAGTAASAS